MSDDPFSTFDAAYVLGALSPEDRHAYEQHLKTCAECAESMVELAGMPGLLSRVPVAQVVSRDVESPPASLLPSLMTEVARERRRRRRLTFTYGAGALAAAACLIVLAVFGVTTLTGRGGAAGPQFVAMSALTSSPLHVEAAFVPASWGTKIELRCTYPSHGKYAGDSYALVVIDKQGREQQAGTWWAGPGTDTTVTGSTDVPRAQIASIEVRRLDGGAILQLDPGAPTA